MTKLTTQPVDAVIGMLINDFDKSVFNGGLSQATPTNGMRGNILKADNFSRYKPDKHRTTAYYVVGVPASGIYRYLGQYTHTVGKYPVYIEIHSHRSDDEAEAWKEEAMEILWTRRKNISNLYSDYRRIDIEGTPQDVSVRLHFKWVINLVMRGHVEVLPQETYDGGAALDGMPKGIIDGGDA